MAEQPAPWDHPWVKEHPDWSNEAVARGCGFTDRSYFQRKFKDLTGQTPAEWRVKE